MANERKHNFLRIIAWWLEQFGIRPLRFFRALYEFPYVVKNYIKFRKSSSSLVTFRMPCLHDRCESSGNIEGDYFYQDLYVARKIFRRNSARLLDVGSRVDGFVAHVASFREIEVMDIRPNQNLPGIVFHQIDLMNVQDDYIGLFDSISCLHALEHFGLGRYGDPIQPDGHKKGLENIIKMLNPQGILYLSVPVGQDKVEFNAHRILSIKTVLELTRNLRLIEFAWLDENSELHECDNPALLKDELFASRIAGLGIFTFQK